MSADEPTPDSEAIVKSMPDSEAIAKLIALFEQVAPDSRERVFRTLGTYLGFGQKPMPQHAAAPLKARPDTGSAIASFTEDRSLSAKEFMLLKQPQNDVERVACLAFYLTHYLNTPHFKTVDISRVNTDAAQIKFANPVFAVSNAATLGYLAPVGKGSKQISALGEQFVVALPDRDAAKAIMATLRKRRNPKRSKSSEVSGE